MSTILIIDDEQMICRALRRFLRQDHIVFTANSAQEADQILRTTTPDVILCDVVMPAEDGLSFYKRMPARLQSRFIFMTGYIPMRFRAMTLVDCPILQKPFLFTAIQSAITQLLVSQQCTCNAHQRATG